MNFTLLMLLIFPTLVLSKDLVVKELNAENERLAKRIEQNNTIIKTRTNSTLSLEESSLKTVKGHSEISLGLESINWGESQAGNAPTIGYSHKFHNNLILGLSYGRFQNDNFPNDGLQTITTITHGFISYNYLTSFNFSVRPLIGYVQYHVSSPDAGILGSPYDTENELSKVLSIENRSGIFSGISIVKDLGANWNMTLRADISKSASLFLSYQI